MEKKYIHDEEHHNLIAPSIIVPYLIENIQPKSVVDVGCGIGTFLNIFKENGIDEILGLDGEWVNYDLLIKNIDKKNFLVVDLETKIDISKKYDLAISLEVAEHIKESSSGIFVQNLVDLSDVIVFSAAFPGQGGQNHINEQWTEYWEEKFEKHGYKFYDVLRPLFWNIEQIPAWYKQNMFLVVKDSENNKWIIENFIRQVEVKNRINFIHPEYYYSLLNQNKILNRYYDDYISIKKGKKNIFFYMKLFIKVLLVKLKIR